MAGQVAAPDGGRRRLAARYDLAAPGWTAGIARLGYGAAYRALVARAAAEGRLAGGGGVLRVLDAGCGAGDFARALAEAAPRPASFDLVDLSPAMLGRAEAALRGVAAEVRAIEGAIEGAPLDPEGYDVVLCAHLLEHLGRPERALERLRGGLRPGGVLLLVANRPHWCTRLIQWRWRSRAFAPEALLRHLGAAGFGRVSTVAFNAGPPSRTSLGYVACA